MAGTSKRGLNASKSRSSGFKGAGRSAGRTPATNTKRVEAPKLPYEKSVRPTRRTVDLKPLRESRAAKAPARGAGVDRRRQIVGTDEPKGSAC